MDIYDKIILVPEFQTMFEIKTTEGENEIITKRI